MRYSSNNAVETFQYKSCDAVTAEGTERAGERLRRGGRTDGPTARPTPVFYHTNYVQPLTATTHYPASPTHISVTSDNN